MSPELGNFLYQTDTTAVTYPAKDFRVDSTWQRCSSIPPSATSLVQNNLVLERMEDSQHTTATPSRFKGHGFSVPYNDSESSPEPSRENSVQVSESCPRSYYVPSIDLETESESDEIESANEDPEVEIASSVQDENDLHEIVATTPEQGATDKQGGQQDVEAASSAKSPAETGVRGLNLKGPRLNDVIKITPIGTSQFNPIDLEGTCTHNYDVSDTESEDDGPEILPIPHSVSSKIQSAEWKEPQLALPQYSMPPTEDKAADLATDDLIKHIIKDTQARNTNDNLAVTQASPKLSMNSIAGATDRFDSEDDDPFSDEEDPFSDYSEPEEATTTPKIITFASTSESAAPSVQRFPAVFKSYLPVVSEPVIRGSESVSVSRPGHDSVSPHVVIQRAPSPSDAALARKVSGSRPIQDPAPMDIRKNEALPKNAEYQNISRDYSPFEPLRAHQCPKPSRLYQPAEWAQELHSKPYVQGPFSRHDDSVAFQYPSTADKIFMPDFDDNFQAFQPSNGLYNFQPDTAKNEIVPSSSYEGRKETDNSSAKINIASLVNTDHAEINRSAKRKADDISSSTECEDFVFNNAPKQSATSRSRFSDIPPPPSPYACQAEENETCLPDAQSRDILLPACTESLTQESVVESVAGPISTTTITVSSEYTGPAHKKARTSTSTSGGTARFISGVAVGLVGAFVAFVATIPASVREEALREMASGV